MAANYLHGVETIEIETGPRPVKAVKSAVIGLIGTAPCGPVNQPTLCLSESDAAQFGPGLANFTIPQALKAIYDHGAGTVVVINVLNPAVHKSTIPSETVKVDDNGQIQLKHGAVQTMSIGRSTNAGNAYIKGTDYTIDMLTGKITCMGTNLKPGVQAYVNYTYADPTKVTAADIVGAVNTAGDRTGMKLLQDTWNQFGFYAKILIAPVFCTQNSVAVKLIAQAEALGAITYIDAPIGTTFQQVLAGRGPQGAINF
ncbi:phage tail sheath family protein, partial [Salmonella enterica subsp. enterica serovar Kentucky]|nr:phage tail sheath family protein [Salmonella enterica subsp. enterica serovar Kentucky]